LIAGRSRGPKDALQNVERRSPRSTYMLRQTENPSLLISPARSLFMMPTRTHRSSSWLTTAFRQRSRIRQCLHRGCRRRFMPHERSVDDDDENRRRARLFFVGITRGKGQTCLSLSPNTAKIGPDPPAPSPRNSSYELGSHFPICANVILQYIVIPANAGIRFK